MWIIKRIPLSTSSTKGLVRRIISSKDKSISALAHCSRVISLIFLQNLKEQIKFEIFKKNFGVSFQTLNSIFFKNSKH